MNDNLIYDKIRGKHNYKNGELWMYGMGGVDKQERIADV